MPVSRTLLLNIAVGTLLSVLFGAMLIYFIMAGGVGTQITFVEFLSSAQNVIFTLLMCSFVFASWMMRGPNNRAVLFFWAFAILLHEVILWAIYDYFYFQQVNIYVLNLVGVAATIPAVWFLRLRVTYSCLMLEKLRPLGWFRAEIDGYLEHSNTTDFEFYMFQTMYAAFFLEYAYALYLTLYTLFFEIPANGSVYEHMLQYQHWDPYSVYLPLLNAVTFVYILILCFYLYRDYREPDTYNYGVSDEQKRAVTHKMLQKHRAKIRKKQNKKR